MRYTLKDYQADAVRDVLSNLERARHSYHQWDANSQFSLSATTGAGKTVMAAAIFESLFFGNDEYDFPADPGAVVLWFSDDPSLNEQSRNRLQAAASELDSRLITVESDFQEPRFRPGNVYFLNTQKLSRNSRLVRGEPQEANGQKRLFSVRPDMAQISIYDTISNTIADDNLTLYFVLDEAHRGMGGTSRDRDTIVQRLINGRGSTPPMPIVFGISATVERFEAAMKHAENRDALRPVVVDSTLVQASGLLKDDIVLSIPDEEGDFQTVLLREAVRRIRQSTAEWEAYCESQGESDLVQPLLVVQVGDKPSLETLVQTVSTIYETWPGLDPDAVANVFGEHVDLEIGQYDVPYIAPQRVQESRHIRVLLAKSAISTGWDCPRAEVLISLRPAKDRTHITQLLGRMIRTPLARRIPGNERLNSVDCLLPLFDRSTALSVADMLMKGATSKDADDGSDAGGGQGRRILFNPVTLNRNPDVESAVWQRFESLPTTSIPRGGVKPIRRLTELATALSMDGLVSEAVNASHARLHEVLDGRAVEFSSRLAQVEDDVLNMRGVDIRGRVGGGVFYDGFTLRADPRAIRDYYRAATRAFSPALCNSYVQHLADPEQGDDGLLEAYIRLAAMSRIPEIVMDVERAANILTKSWLTSTRVARKALSDERIAAYDRIESMSTEPEPLQLTAPVVTQADTMLRLPDGTEQKLPTMRLHLMADDEGEYPVDLNDWERRVLETEMARPGFKGWYRNPDRSVKESLAVAYQEAPNQWKALRPDFIFFRSSHTGTVVADLVDPHGHHLADALPKLRGLSDFVEDYGDQFGRVESVAETNGLLRALDMTLAAVRDAVRSAENAKALYESELAVDFI